MKIKLLLIFILFINCYGDNQNELIVANIDQIYSNSMVAYEKTISFLKWSIGIIICIFGYVEFKTVSNYLDCIIKCNKKKIHRKILGIM
jgi:hypothetical protein